MSENHALKAGNGGPWEVTHYRAEIDRRMKLPEGDRERAPETLESLHTKLQRSIAKYGDPQAVKP